MAVDIFFISIVILFVQYFFVLGFIKLVSGWHPPNLFGFYLLATLVSTLGFTLLIFFIKFHFHYTFISTDFEWARNCLGLICFLLICKVYGMMPMEFMIRHLDVE